MTREDAKAFMRKAWRETMKGSYAEEAYEMAIKALEQPTIEPQRWIPCSERLPEKAGHYLCSFETPRRIDNIYVDVAYWTGGMWYGVGKIIAWMPLQKPYKEAEA